LREHGILLPAIRYPTVARGEARLRITASAAHSEADIQQLIEMLRRCLEITGIRPPPSP
jgi:8-amino-7-oxononanoate synthase